MSISTAAIEANSRQMFAILGNAQAKTTELANDIARISIAEKVSTPSDPVLAEAGKGQNVNLTV